MPPLKQVTSLQDMAMNSLVASFLGFCLDKDITLDDTLERISLWKKEIRAGMAPTFVSDFYNRIPKELFSSKLSMKDLSRIWVELVADETIIGLECTSLVQLELPEDAHRIRGITRLQLGTRQLRYSLDAFHLEHLTAFKYTSWCTDSDLQVLGANCPKLEDVDVSYSPAVTDVGLVALASSLPELQLLKLSGCHNVTPSGLNNFLSVIKSIRHLWAWRCRRGPGFDFRELPNWEADLSVSETLESFSITNNFTNEDLLYLVTKFPNLRWIDMSSVGLDTDLNVLKSLSRLSKIEFYAGNGSRWAEFESLLKFFGPQIVDLHVWCVGFSIMQQSLDSIFRLCTNLEDLVFSSYFFELSPSARLVVPPFEELTKFECKSDTDYDHKPKLELGKMPKLGNLVLCGFNVSVTQLESIILDHRNLPNLKQIDIDIDMPRISFSKRHIENIVKTNNLDLIVDITPPDAEKY